MMQVQVTDSVVIDLKFACGRFLGIILRNVMKAD
jgi:hypothetical protein